MPLHENCPNASVPHRKTGRSIKPSNSTQTRAAKITTT